MRELRIGSRGSALALWQANWVRSRLTGNAGREAELVIIQTSGDHFQQAEIARIGVKGVFIKQLEEALLERRIDLAVHSMKDVPTCIPPGLLFPAICEREDPRDCLLSPSGKDLDGLPSGARVGTGSLRRRAQIRHYRQDLEMLPLRGNVDTRVRKLDRGEYDAIVLAKAGLDRLGWTSRITSVLPPEICLPAVGQGALGVETRADDRETLELVRALDHAESRAAVTAERALLEEMEGGCQVPLGAWARIEQGSLILDACVFSEDGKLFARRRGSGSPDQPQELGRRVAQMLLEEGGAEILKLAGRTSGRA